MKQFGKGFFLKIVVNKNLKKKSINGDLISQSMMSYVFIWKKCLYKFCIHVRNEKKHKTDGTYKRMIYHFAYMS